ncbi:hypothetical protein glysoja_046613, partial [Glycine soja]
IWQLCYSWLGFQLVLPIGCCGHFWIHYGLIKGVKSRGVLMFIWVAAVWSIWNHRNVIIFRNQQPCAEYVIEEIKSKSWGWIKAKYKCFQSSYYEWHSQPFLCL